MDVGNTHHPILHKQLKEHMMETMKTTVSDLYKVTNKNEELVNQIFSNYVFVKEKKEPHINEDWHLTPLLHKQVTYLHHLYNDPDQHSHISSITQHKKTMHQFHKEMRDAFVFAKIVADEEGLEKQDVPKPDSAPAPTYQSEDFEPAKTTAFSEDFHDIPEPAKLSPQQQSAYLIDFEPYVLKPEPKQPTKIDLKSGERFELPPQSDHFSIKGEGKNNIVLKSHCEEIKIDLDRGKIHIHEHCSNITIDAGNSSTIKIDYDCSNIQIHGFDLDYTIHKDCKNISVNGLLIRE